MVAFRPLVVTVMAGAVVGIQLATCRFNVVGTPPPAALRAVTARLTSWPPCTVIALDVVLAGTSTGPPSIPLIR